MNRGPFQCEICDNTTPAILKCNIYNCERHSCALHHDTVLPHSCYMCLESWCKEHQGRARWKECDNNWCDKQSCGRCWKTWFKECDMCEQTVCIPRCIGSTSDICLNCLLEVEKKGKILQAAQR